MRQATFVKGAAVNGARRKVKVRVQQAHIVACPVCNPKKRELNRLVKIGKRSYTRMCGRVK